MIFVTVGTHEQPFNRLVKAVDDLKMSGKITDSGFIQTGYSTYVPKACEYKDFISMNQMNGIILLRCHRNSYECGSRAPHQIMFFVSYISSKCICIRIRHTALRGSWAAHGDSIFHQLVCRIVKARVEFEAKIDYSIIDSVVDVEWSDFSEVNQSTVTGDHGLLWSYNWTLPRRCSY